MRSNSPVFWFKLSAVAVVLGGVLGFGACGGGDEGGGGGGSGGDSGGSGGKGGGGKGGSGNLQARKVENCSKGNTVGEIEKNVINGSCAGSGCHVNSIFGQYKYSATMSWAPNFFDKPSKSLCLDRDNNDVGENVIDKSNPENSLFLRLVKEEEPKCKDGSKAGSRMPRAPADRLDDETITCLEEYIKAVVAD